MLILAGSLYHRFNKFNMLIATSSLTFLGGIGMIYTIQNIGVSEWFAFWYCYSWIIDIVNDFVCFAMVNSYLLIESRGTVLVLVYEFNILFSAFLTYLNGQLNNIYQSS
jgi:hypothetical protein